jgi:hypothetical protein
MGDVSDLLAPNLGLHHKVGVLDRIVWVDERASHFLLMPHLVYAGHDRLALCTSGPHANLPVKLGGF